MDGTACRSCPAAEHPQGEDDLLRGSVRELVDVAVLGPAAEEWFFPRYSDPNPHLRLRFRGEPSRLTDLLLPQLFAWAARLQQAGLCTSLVVDTCDPEVDGTAAGPPSVWPRQCSVPDSAAVVDLLDILATRPDVDPIMREDVVLALLLRTWQGLQRR